MARSLNKVTLIGNLTRDPELRYTPQGTAVCTFGIATNRQWSTDSGEKKEDVEFHKVVAWQKLAELCSQLLAKGRKVYVEGRLQTRKWTGQDNVERTTTEIVIHDMMILDSRGATGGTGATPVADDIPDDVFDDFAEGEVEVDKPGAKTSATKSKNTKTTKKSEEDNDDIPF